MTRFPGTPTCSFRFEAAVNGLARTEGSPFYVATEGVRFSKLQVPMCLSHHPDSALTEEEVLARARR